MKRLLLSLLLLALLPAPPAEARQERTSLGPAAMSRSKAKPARRSMTTDKLRETAIKAGPMRPTFDQSHRRNFPDPKKGIQKPSPGAYPWHFDITATYFYIGERATKNNPVPNTASSWDSAWDDNYGGFDDPNPANRDPRTFAPLGFTPQLNPFYVALPYNDIDKGGPKPEAEKVIPWYRRYKGGKLLPRLVRKM